VWGRLPTGGGGETVQEEERVAQFCRPSGEGLTLLFGERKKKSDASQGNTIINKVLTRKLGVIQGQGKKGDVRGQRRT